MTTRQQIREKAVEILANEPQGLRYSDLHERIAKALPGINRNSISDIWNLEIALPELVYKPARGLYLHTKYRENAIPTTRAFVTSPEALKEEDFYKTFAEWLVKELEECTKAIPVGGNRFKDKWGTPDVVGVLEPKKSDIIKPPTEIVAVEIKLDTASLITAFGQACAYKLFSHKSYIVVPVDSREDDIDRLDALARIFGIGLILFNAKNVLEPNFQIRVRAAKHDPDMFYANRCIGLIEEELFT